MVILVGHLFLKGSIKSRALYHEILLIQKFNDILGKILFLSNKKSPSSLKEKIETGFLVLDLKNLHELSENFNVTYNFKVVN